MFECESGMAGDSGSDLLFVTAMEGDDMVEGRSGGDFAGGLESSGDLSNALGRDGVLSSGIGEVHSVLNVVEDTLTEIEREWGRHGGGSLEEPPP